MVADSYERRLMLQCLEIAEHVPRFVTPEMVGDDTLIDFVEKGNIMFDRWEREERAHQSPRRPRRRKRPRR